MSSFQVIFVFVLSIWESFVALAQGSCSSERSSTGREFIFGVIESYSPSSVKVNIAAEKPGKVWIRAPAVGIDRHYLIHSGTRHIAIPIQIIQRTNNTVGNKSIYLKSDTDISVNVIHVGPYSREGFLALPLSNYSNRYVIQTVSPSFGSRYPSEVLLAASRNSTKISILFPEDMTGKSIANNSVTISLNEYQTYLYKSSYDLSGTYIQGSAPISVVAGTVYTSGNYGSLVMEQIPSEEYFGMHFIVPTLIGRSGYRIKMLAIDDHILATLYNRTGKYQFMIYRGLPITLYNENELVFISSQHPILVVQHALSYDIEKRGSDFTMVMPSISNYMKHYDFLVPISLPDANFISVILPATKSSDVLLDSSPISAVNVSHIKTTEGNFTVLTTNVSSGRHSLTSKSGNSMFGALFYGYYSDDGYGFPIGMKINVKNMKECLTTTPPTTILPMSQTTEFVRHITDVILTTGSGINIAASERPSSNGTGLYCFDCQEVSHLYLCNTVKRCRPAELCSVAQFATTNGYIKYRSGCLNEQICPASEHRRNTHPVDCVQCCTGHFCNNHGCDGQSLPDRRSRGPLCFDCQHVESVEECGTLTLCHHDQVCSIQEVLWGDRYRHFNMGCSSNQCIPNKRSTPICENCCTQDFCNQNCTRAPPVTIVDTLSQKVDEKPHQMYPRNPVQFSFCLPCPIL